MKGILPTEIWGGGETQEDHSAQACLFFLSAGRAMSVPHSVKQAFIDFATEMQIDREQIFLLARKGKMPRWASVRERETKKEALCHSTWGKLVQITYKMPLLPARRDRRFLARVFYVLPCLDAR